MGGNLLVYLLLLSYIVLYTYFVRPKEMRLHHFVFLISPVIILLIMVLGLQKGVGTDYQSYYQMGAGVHSMYYLQNRSEFLFVILARFVQKLGVPQLLFLFVGVVQMTFLMLIVRDVNRINLKLHQFFYLYFTLSLAFFNQFNLIRQYIAVYIVVYALLKLMQNRVLPFIILVVVASLFHSSAIFFLAFILLRRLLERRYSPLVVTITLMFLMILSTLNLNNLWFKLLSFTKYANYITSNYMGRMAFRGVLTKLPKLAIVIFAANSIKTGELDEKRNWLLNMSYLSCAVLIMSFSASVVWRFYQYFDLFLVFPVMFLFEDKSKNKINAFIWLALLFMLIVKIVLFPEGEYLYNSIIGGINFDFSNY